jgi:hypothetical protein
MFDAFNAPWPPTPAMTTFTTLFGGGKARLPTRFTGKAA